MDTVVYDHIRSMGQNGEETALDDARNALDKIQFFYIHKGTLGVL